MPSLKNVNPTSASSPVFLNGKRNLPVNGAGPAGIPVWKAWLLATRPATWSAAIVPVLVGTAAAAATGRYSIAVMLAALFSSLLIQIGTNFANDLFDFQKGADTAERTGPLRVTQAGLLTPRQVATGTAVVFGSATAIGLYLVYVGGWPILLIGLLGIASGILYTGGPWPLGYHGLGDLFVFVFFGLVAVMGTYYLHTGVVDLMSFLISLPVAFLVTAILVVNNLRDVDTDKQTGKITLAVRLGAPATRWQYTLLAVGAYVIPPALWLARAASPVVVLPLLTLPLCIRLVRVVLQGTKGAALNRVLQGTGRLNMIYGLLFALGLLMP